jgi:hypothetical protein
LVILNSTILDSSFVVTKKNYTVEDNSSSTRAMVLVIVACIIAAAALTGGIIFTVKKYKQHKKKVEPGVARNYALSKNADVSGLSVGNAATPDVASQMNITNNDKILNESQLNEIVTIPGHAGDQVKLPQEVLKSAT